MEQQTSENMGPGERFYIFFLRLLIFVSKKIPFFGRPTKDLIILCYHSVGEHDWLFSVTPQNFYEQMKLLKNNRKILTIKEIIEDKNRYCEGGVIVTFDDGYTDVIKNALPVLKELEIPAVLFVLGETGNADRGELGNEEPLMSTEDILVLCREGWEIGYHTKTHPNLSRLDKEKLREEIVEGKERLERQLGIKIDYFSYPRGIYSEEIIEKVREGGYKAAFTVDGGPVSINDIYKLRRITIKRNTDIEEFEAIMLPLGVWFTAFYVKVLNFKQRLLDLPLKE